VGDEVFELFETNHPYSHWGPIGDQPQLIWSEEIYSPGASYICPHFSRFELAPGDFVVVRSPDGERSWRYEETGKGKLGVTEGFWAIHIPGDTAIVELFSADPEGAYGFTIDRYARGFPREWRETPFGEPNNICGVDDTEWARCYTSSEPAIYAKSQAVARLLIDGSWACTGWLVGSEGHLITNNHCISTQSSALNTNFEFMAEGATCATACDWWGACPGTVEATSSTLVQTSSPNDYSLLSLPTNLSGSYGFFQLRKEGGVVNERIYLPQHPAHYGKKIAVNSTAANDESGYTELFTSVSNGETMVWLYFADTQGGSSGSPVVAYSDHMVVALHHAAYEDPCSVWGNGGPIIQEVISDLAGNLPKDAVIYTLTAAITGSGSGTVTSSPSGISCPGDCSEDYGNKTVITLTPNPGSGSVFSGWSGDSDCSDGQVTLDADITCTATFGLEGETHALTVATSGTGSGTVTSTPSGISCPGDCSEDYDDGQVVTLAAAAASGSDFTGWSGDADCSDGVVTMNSEVSCTATFTLQTHTLGVAMAGTGSGTVSSTPSGISCPGDCSEDYDHGQVVALTPNASSGSQFTGWSGDADCSDGVVTVDSAVSCTATFDLETHTLSISIDGDGTGFVLSTPSGIICPDDCSEDYNHAQMVTLNPIAATGSDFSGWSGDADCSDGVVTMNGAVSCTATFDLEIRSLAVSTAGDGSGTVTSTPSGISCPGDCGENFDYGEVVTLTATPATGSDFVGWSGDADCSDGIVTMTSNLSCTATFDLEMRSLSVSTAGDGSGTVTSSPSGISCPGDCGEDYDYGQVVTLTPVAATGSSFAGWSGDADCSDGVVTMTSNVSCTATFDQVTHSLAVAAVGDGTGTVTSSPAGISCPGDCGQDYDYGTVVTLTPTPATGSDFSGWSGDADCADGVVTMTSDLSCTATFDLETRLLGAGTAGVGSGTVTSVPSGISCPGDCEESYDYGTVVTLTATAATGSDFVQWMESGDCSDGVVTMIESLFCTAIFELETRSLSVATAGDGSGTVTSSPVGISCPGDCGEDYDYGQEVTLTPTPASGSTFAGWSGDADCSDGVVTMDSNRLCTATFDVETHSLTVSLAGDGSGTVTSTPAGISCPGDCGEDYDYGQVVTLTPAAAAGSVFAGWSGDADCTDGEVTIDASTSCTATFNLNLSADLSIAMGNGVCEVDDESLLTYTIVVGNDGPGHVVGAQVEDTFPVELTACEWTCDAFDGADCIAGPVAGDLADQADLPVSSTVVYTATCSVAEGAEDELITNTATAAVPEGMTDPDASNNSDSAVNYCRPFVFSDGFASGDLIEWSGVTSD
jgi:uncharacterized repeat protein (TIGR01451 family)